MSSKFGQLSQEEVTIVLTQLGDELHIDVVRQGFDKIRRPGTSVRLWASLAAFGDQRVPSACHLAGAWLNKNAQDRIEELQAFAEHGAALFRDLFPEQSDRNLFRRLIAADDDGVYPRLAVINQAAVVPWEALCPVEEGETPGIEDFLGWKHIIVRKTASYAYARRKAPRHLKVIHAVEDDGLASVNLGHAQTARERYPASTYLTLARLTADPADIRKFHEHFFPSEGGLDVVHFDTHFQMESESHPNAHVRVTERVSIPLREFQKDRLDIGHLPFVLFNGCNGGAVGRGQVISLAHHMCEAGAASVVAGECTLGDDFCVEFTKTFYAVAANALTVGEALLETRRRFLVVDHNPLALFYGLYGGPDLLLGATDCLAPEPASGLARRLAWPDALAA